MTDGRRRGRPRVALSRSHRLRHIRVAFDRLVRRLTIGELCRLHEIARSTAYQWIGWALRYDDPEAEGLRRFAP